MFKNRTAQLVVQSSYMTLSVVALGAFFGLFNLSFKWDGWLLFTNLSNFFCMGIMVAELVQTIKKKEDSYVTLNPTLKFSGLVSILFTAVFYYALYATKRDAVENFKIGSLLPHAVLPLLYFVDWVLFYEKNTAKVTDPLMALIFPASYLAFIYLHAACYGFDTSIPNFANNGPYIYPYALLNVEIMGIGKVIMWCALLLAALLAIGYSMFGLDKLFYRLLNKKKANKVEEH